MFGGIYRCETAVKVSIGSKAARRSAQRCHRSCMMFSDGVVVGWGYLWYISAIATCQMLWFSSTNTHRSREFSRRSRSASTASMMYGKTRALSRETQHVPCPQVSVDASHTIMQAQRTDVVCAAGHGRASGLFVGTLQASTARCRRQSWRFCVTFSSTGSMVTATTVGRALTVA